MYANWRGYGKSLYGGNEHILPNRGEALWHLIIMKHGIGSLLKHVIPCKKCCDDLTIRKLAASPSCIVVCSVGDAASVIHIYRCQSMTGLPPRPAAVSEPGLNYRTWLFLQQLRSKKTYPIVVSQTPDYQLEWIKWKPWKYRRDECIVCWVSVAAV